MLETSKNSCGCKQSSCVRSSAPRPFVCLWLLALQFFPGEPTSTICHENRGFFADQSCRAQWYAVIHDWFDTVATKAPALQHCMQHRRGNSNINKSFYNMNYLYDKHNPAFHLLYQISQSTLNYGVNIFLRALKKSRCWNTGALFMVVVVVGRECLLFLQFDLLVLQLGTQQDADQHAVATVVASKLC